MSTARALPGPQLPDLDTERSKLQALRTELSAAQEFYESGGWKHFEQFLIDQYGGAQMGLEAEGTSPARTEFLRGRIDFIKLLLRKRTGNETEFNRNTARFEELRLLEEEHENGD